MMKKLLIFAFSVSGLVVFAQKTHTVEAKENPYSISKKYGISIDELYKLNPKVKDGKLNIGDVLVISKKADEKPKNTAEKPVASISGNVTKIVLQPKQTIYGITKQYHIAEADLRKLNPELDSHLKIGDEVTLPAENVKKYADKNAFNRNFAVTIPAPVVETPKMETPAEKSTADEGSVLVISKKADEKPKNTAEKPVASISGNVTKIVLQPKQTIYGITKQYHIAEADLRKLNPELDSHLKIGDEVTLPAENVKKYADKNAFNRNFAVTIPAPVVETPKMETPTEKSTADEGSYVIQPKDNYYKITKSFGISQKDLFDMNPGLEEKGLQPGAVIKVKKSTNSNNSSVKETVSWQEDKKASKQETALSEDEYQTYTVQDGDTVFGILNKFGITLDQLLALNPKLTDGLKAGMVLKVKKLESAYVKKNDGALNIVLMLPFGFDAGDSKYRTMAADFLTGAKLAIERNAKSGQKLEVKVVDAGSESSFKNSLSQINQDNTDLIIGPFFKSSVLDVLDYVKSKKIPVVAPFANSTELRSFNNLVITETDEQVFADKIIKEVSQAYSDQKIYLVSGTDKSNSVYIKNSLEKQIKNPNIIIVNSPAEIQLDNNMMTGQNAPIMAVLASDDNGLGKDFAQKMVDLAAETTGVKAFSMSYNPAFETYEEGLRKASLVYLMDRKINMDGAFEKEILESYKKQYCKSPSKYAVVGFDVVNDMLSRENSKGELFKQMSKTQTQLATKFEFIKSKEGAYINTGCRVVRLIP